MGMSEYIAKRFIGKEICVALDEEAETITFAEVWANNKEFLHGVAINVDDDILELNIPPVGTIHINCNYIKMLWQPPFNWRKAIKVSLTDKPIAPSGH